MEKYTAYVHALFDTVCNISIYCFRQYQDKLSHFGKTSVNERAHLLSQYKVVLSVREWQLLINNSRS